MSLNFREVDRARSEHQELTSSFHRDRCNVSHVAADAHVPSQLVAVTANGFVQLVNLPASTFKLYLLHLAGTPLEAPFRCAALSPGMYLTRCERVQLLFSLSHSNELLCGDLQSGAVQVMNKFRSRPSALYADGDYIACGDSSGSLCLWRATIPEGRAPSEFLLWQRQASSAAIASISINRDVIVVASDDFSVKVLSVATGEALSALLTEAARIVSVVGCPPPTDDLILLSEKGSVTVYTPTTLARTTWSPRIVFHTFAVSCAALTNGFLAVGGTGGRVALYDVSAEDATTSDTDVGSAAKRQALVCYDLGHAIRHAAVTEDGYFVVATAAGDVWRWPMSDVIKRPAAAETLTENADESLIETPYAAESTSVNASRGAQNQTSNVSDANKSDGDAGGHSSESSGEQDPAPATASPQPIIQRPVSSTTASRSPSLPPPHDGGSTAPQVSISAARFGDGDFSHDLDEVAAAGIAFSGAEVGGGGATGDATVIYMDDDDEDNANHRVRRPRGHQHNHQRVPTPPQEPHEVASNPTTHRTLDGDDDDDADTAAIPSTVNNTTHNQTKDELGRHLSAVGGNSSTGNGSDVSSLRRAHFAADVVRREVSRSPAARVGTSPRNHATGTSPSASPASPSRRAVHVDTEAVVADELRDVRIAVDIPGLRAGRRMDPRVARATVERAALPQPHSVAPHELSIVHDNNSSAGVAAMARSALETSAYVTPEGRFDARRYAEDHKPLAQALEYRFAIPAQNFSRDDIVFNAIGLTSPAAGSENAAGRSMISASTSDEKENSTGHDGAADRTPRSGRGSSPPPPPPAGAAKGYPTSNSSRCSNGNNSPVAAVDANCTNRQLDELMDATFHKFVRKRDDVAEKQRAKPGPDIRRHLCDDLLFPARGASTVFFSEHAPALPPPQSLVLPLPVPPTPPFF